MYLQWYPSYPCNDKSDVLNTELVKVKMDLLQINLTACCPLRSPRHFYKMLHIFISKHCYLKVKFKFKW